MTPEETRREAVEAEAKERAKEARAEANMIARQAAEKCKYGNLLFLRIPDWASSLVGNFRHDAQISPSINDVTLFIAIESNDICTYNPEDQVDALRTALSLPRLKGRKHKA